MKPPKAFVPVIVPLASAAVQFMLEACWQRKRWVTKNGHVATAARSTGTRDKAPVLFLLDTGCRASGVCGLKVGDLNLKNGTATVRGKGDNTRIIAFGSRAGNALFRYWAMRGDLPDSAPAFESRDGQALTRSGLLILIRRIGERAGVSNCYPHRLRHTFATTYLRNGGNIYVQQRQLDHSSLDMVKRYLTIAGNDSVQAHKIASPVDNWGL